MRRPVRHFVACSAIAAVISTVVCSSTSAIISTAIPNPERIGLHKVSEMRHGALNCASTSSESCTSKHAGCNDVIVLPTTMHRQDSTCVQRACWRTGMISLHSSWFKFWAAARSWQLASSPTRWRKFYCRAASWASSQATRSLRSCSSCCCASCLTFCRSRKLPCTKILEVKIIVAGPVDILQSRLSQQFHPLETAVPTAQGAVRLQHAELDAEPLQAIHPSQRIVAIHRSGHT